MASPRVVLDTDILSAVIRGNPAAIARARAYLQEHGQFHVSVITRYEILRGLKVKGAEKQVARFDDLCTASTLLHVTDEVVTRAADIYSRLSQLGQLVGDADILIAASAMVHGFGVATNNERHFRRISDLHVENWLV